MNARIEEKHVSTKANSYHHMIQKILATSNIKKKHKKRTVTSIYYDTPGLSLAFGSLRGDPSRIKIRARTYFDTNLTSLDFYNQEYVIEMKLKKGRVGNKILNGNLTWEQLFCRDNLKKSGVNDSCLKPICGITYERDYFTEIGTANRITVDQKIQIFKISQQQKRLINVESHNNISVLELKRPVSSYMDGSTYNRSLGFSKNRFSKYLYALSRLGYIEYIF